jgi:hypothetical protein
MKDKLMAIFNTMKMVETKGESTLIMADCMRELAKVINDIPNVESEVPTNE